MSAPARLEFIFPNVGDEMRLFGLHTNSSKNDSSRASYWSLQVYFWLYLSCASFGLIVAIAATCYHTYTSES
jgi:hypothetical protein